MTFALEEITGVALLTKDGALWSLPKPHRHHHIFALAAFIGSSAEPGTQGFTTSFGRFVTRKEAIPIANDSGQNKRTDRDVMMELYSEDLW